MRKYIIIAARGILVAAIIFWMMTIFGFSAAEGDVSQSTSDIITGEVIEHFVEEYEEMPIPQQEILWNKISFVVRKIGHFGEYSILAVLILMLMLTFEKVRHNYRWLIIDCIICFLYAVTDEFHQSFVAGRSARIMDVFIDTSGSLIVVAVAIISVHFLNLHTEEKQQQKR